MTDQALDHLLCRVMLDASAREYGGGVEALPEHDFSPAFEKKMGKLLRRADHPIRYRLVQAAACLLLAALLSGCTVLAVSPEAREAFAGWVREVYEGWLVYRYTGQEQPASEDTVYTPAWVPEGYEATAAPQVGTFVRTQYENGEKDLLTFSYLKGTKTSSLNVEWEGAAVQRTSVGNLPADLYLNPDNGPNVLVWTDLEKDAIFWITAPLPEEDLVQIAASVQKSDPIPKRYRVSLLPMRYGAYSILSETEGDGCGETVYENEQGFSITFGYSHDGASAPHPRGEAVPVYVGDRQGALYPALEDGGDKTLLWTTEDETVLWVRAPLPDEELLLIGENAIVSLRQFTDLIQIQVFDEEAPLLESVERALTEEYVAQVEDCARRAAQTGQYASKEYDRLWKEQQAQYISPERDEALERVAALANALRREGRSGESIVSLFGPFYTASIHVSDFSYDDYRLLVSSDLLEFYFDTTAHIVDERGVLIASYQINSLSGNGEVFSVPTAEEMQFSYLSNQIYLNAYRAAQAEP